MSDNPLLAKIKLPGRIFQLPSRGALYTNGELSPSCVNGEIHVHPMSALDEIAMKNPDMLFSGKAAEEVLKACIPEVLKPLELFGRDIDAIMLFLRAVTYGQLYEIDTTHGCEGGKTHSYNVDVEQLITSMSYLDPTTVKEQYSIVLENGQVVRTQPIRYRHVIEILQGNDGSKKMTGPEMQKNLIKNLLNLVVDVDGITDRKNIEEWAKALPVKMTNRIADSIETSNSWGPNLTSSCKCLDCGEEFTVEVPINPISFFSE